MSSRALRRLQGKDSFIDEIDDVNDTNQDIAVPVGGARRKTLPVNPYDVLNDSLSESDTNNDAQEVEEEQSIEPQNSKSKKKKKKKKKPRKSLPSDHAEEENLEFDDDEFGAGIQTHGDESSESNQNPTSTSFYYIPTCGESNSVMSIKIKNLKPINEMKKIFGSRIVEDDNRNRRNRSTICIKNYIFVNPKNTWPALGKTGISMVAEKVDGRLTFNFVHSPEYQKLQRRFLSAVDSFDPDNIGAILNYNPYHVDTLIQLSDLYKVNEDLQRAAELVERALYCFEAAFHPLFNIAKGNYHMDSRRQENRAFFTCLFKHLLYVGERACYRTALELSKLLLLLDFDADPLASVLCMDFYSLRSRNYSWLINVANELEAKKNLLQLPNFAYSTALAHFYLAQNDPSEDLSVADEMLQNALILFPAVLSQLTEKCSIQCDEVVTKHRFFTSDADLSQTQALHVLIALYVNRTYHEWKNPKILPWLERNVHTVLQRVKLNDPFVLECSENRSKRYPSTPRNVMRHVLLSDIKEVTTLIVNDITTPILSFDPLPPIDSVDIYTRQPREQSYEHSPTLSLFFRSLLPNYNVNAQQGNMLFVDEAANGAQMAEHDAAVGHLPTSAAIGDTLRYSVTVLMDAIGVVLANMPLRDGDSGNDGHQFRREFEDENISDEVNGLDGSIVRRNSFSESTVNDAEPNRDIDNEHL